MVTGTDCFTLQLLTVDFGHLSCDKSLTNVTLAMVFEV